MPDFFHVDHDTPYAEKSLLNVGDVIETASRSCNPFYKRTLDFVYSISVDNNEIRLLEFLNLFKSSTKAPNQLTRDMHIVLDDYIKVIREMEFENVRREAFPFRPSRTRCVWLASDFESAKSWLPRLEDRRNARILRVRVDSEPFATNEAYLQRDAHSIEETRDYARQYWEGVPHSRGRTELLVEGKIEVVEVC